MARYLEKRRRVWYAVLNIPDTLAGKHDLPRRRFIVSTETDSESVARKVAANLVKGWQAKIDACRPPSPASDTAAAILRRKLGNTLEGLREIETDRGVDYVRDDAGVLRPVPPDAETTVVSIESNVAPPIILRAVIAAPFDAHLDEWIAASKATQKTRDMQRSDAREFAGEFRTIASVTKPEVRRWCDRLMGNGLTLKTMQRKLSALRGYWAYLQSIEQAPSGPAPFKELRLKGGGKAKREDRRAAFEPADVLKLLAEAGEDQELADIIVVARWSGARIEEIAALRIEAVNLAAEIPSFTVNAGKTDAAIREVPVHAELEPVLRRLIGDRPSGFVFAGLSENKYHDRSNAIGKRFGYLKARLGFDGRFVFHSIRKTVATLLENAGVPENVAADIVGHDKPTMTYGLYSGGASLAVKAKAIAMLNYRKESKPKD